MMTKEYEENVIRMFDSLRSEEHKGKENCAGVACYDCPFFEKICNMGGIIRRHPHECVENIGRFVIHPYETIEIVNNWVKEHPVMTNVMKFKEIFGIQPSEISSCDDFWNSPCKEQEPKTDQQIGTGNEQECHEIHKRYGKGGIKMTDIEKNLKHEVSELICLKCLNRWIGVYPETTLLKDLECKCGEVGCVIKTGQTIETVMDCILDPKDRNRESEDKSGKKWGDFHLW